MLSTKKIIFLITWLLQLPVAFSQHPNTRSIDSLKNLIPKAKGIQRINCLNKLCEEYWWPPRIYPDSIYGWASTAYKEATAINYPAGVAESIMLIGVSEIYRRNFVTAEKYLEESTAKFNSLKNDFGIGWSNTWLGQSYYFQNRFTEALDCYYKSLYHLNKIGDWDAEAKAWAWMGGIHANLGNYDSSYFYCSKSLWIRQKMSDQTCVTYAFTNMGNLYKVAGAYKEALDNCKKAFYYGHEHDVDEYTINWSYLEPTGAIFRSMNMPDSSYYYLQKAIENDPNNVMTRISMAETLLMTGQYDSALATFLKPIDHFRKENNQWELMRVLLDAAKAYFKKNDNKTALTYARESFAIGSKAGAKQFILEGYALLSQIYQRLKINDSAYACLAQYAKLKDSVVNKQFLWKLSNYKEQAEFKNQQEQLSLLNRENKIKAAKLQQEAMVKWFLLAGLVIAALSGFIIYRNLSLKRKNDKLASLQKHSELQLKATELEMQALRAQMNPHFIFNCLSSINSYILKNETESASDYLTKFSRLVRMVLVNSNKPFITLEEELNMLTLYLDMERLRFKNSFDYNISFTNSIDISNILIPPLLLQPFVENAIWHGLMHKPGPGKLDIILSAENKMLTCIICDNGIGISNASSQTHRSVKKEKSMGLKITADRLALLNKDAGQETTFTIEDTRDAENNITGTKVTLKMYYKSLMEVRA